MFDSFNSRKSPADVCFKAHISVCAEQLRKCYLVAKLKTPGETDKFF